MPDRNIWFDLHREGPGPIDVAIIGMPFDGSSSRHRGAGEAPDRLREISRTADPITRWGDPIEGIRLRDFGDVESRDAAGKPVPQGDFLEAARKRIAGLPECRLWIGLGGDNSVSIPGIRTFAERHGAGAGIVWFDAHPDLFGSYDGNPDSHACALRRAMTLAQIPPARVLLLATRSFSTEENRFIRDNQILIITAHDWLKGTTEEVAGKILEWGRDLTAVYLAVDIDGFDASSAPGTGYPMPGGIGSEDFFSLLERICETLPVRAMDLTEIAPRLDTNDRTGFLGVQIILETLGAIGKAG